MRLSTMPTTFCEKLVLIRIFDPDMFMKSFTDLDFTKTDNE